MRLPALAALATLSLSAHAGQPLAGSDAKNPILEFHWHENEWQLDLYTAYANYEGDTGYGGGLGLTYFFHYYFGAGVDVSYLSHERGGWTGSAYLVGRYPFEVAHRGISPYVKISGGVTGHQSTAGFLGLGGGVEFRLSSRWGIFGEGTSNFAGAGEDFSQARFGIRLVF